MYVACSRRCAPAFNVALNDYSAAQASYKSKVYIVERERKRRVRALPVSNLHMSTPLGTHPKRPYRRSNNGATSYDYATSASVHIKFKIHITINPIDIFPSNPTFNQSLLPDNNVSESPSLVIEAEEGEELSANRSTHRTGRIGVSGSGGIRCPFSSFCSS